MSRREHDEDAYWLALQDRAEMRRMPSGIRGSLSKVRSSYHRGHLLLETREDVRQIAARQGHVRTADDFPFSVTYVPAIFQRHILGKLGSDQSYLTQLRARVRARLREANVTRPRSAASRGVPRVLPDCRPPPAGEQWRTQSDLGFGTSTVLEAPPDAFAVGIAQRAWQRRLEQSSGPQLVIDPLLNEWIESNGLDRDVELLTEPAVMRVLIVGSFPGTMTRALVATMPASARLMVCEVDTVGEGTPLPGIVAEFSDRTSSLSTKEPFDLIVMIVPPPSQGAQYRHRYVAEAGGYRSLHAPRAFDMGSLGPARWRKALAYRFGAIAGRLAADAELVVLLPESVRVPLGYEPARLLDEGDLLDCFDAAGFSVCRELRLRELEPALQPFVADRRPERRCFIATVRITAPKVAP